ncbi:single-stranded-DNA-specific exonuclease RecJ [Paenibacillus sp. MBLB4367]|uniref:single-stranded-DNA-specific exonuclease RecJ n=1 Tax=Paenibacillus sp. MBLB4367 TaxID=3384767 RepID=UPI003907EA7A
MKWIEKPQNYSAHALSYYSSAFYVEPLTTKLLFSRGICNEDAFSKYAYPSITDLHNPFLLNDMKKAVIRIIRALKNQEKIVIYGDYDVDGITSATLLYKGLRFFNAEVTSLLPTRKDGYGITINAIERMEVSTPSLIITVDNGSNAHDALRYAASKGIDVIVTDHHEINGLYPMCYAFINPKRYDNEYPNSSLAGAGVAFKLVQALFEASDRHEWITHAWDFIELATLGTIADLMPLTGENRVITKLGLSKMNANPSAHLRRLFQLLRLSAIDSSTLSFLIAPIFNSCGRIGDPNDALRALINNEPQIDEFQRFIEQNNERKRMTQECFQLLDKSISIQGLNKHKVITVCGDYPEGLIGILAAMISEKYHKPSIVITAAGKGSCRSVQNSNFSIANTISRCSQLLKAYGGHQAAAGLTVDINVLDQFTAEVQKSAELEPTIDPIKYFDGEIPLKKLSNEIFEDCSTLMEPFGIGNEKPIFRAQNVTADYIEYFGRQKQHAKLLLSGKHALLFGRANLFKDNNNGMYDFLYSPNSYWQKNFIIEDIRMLEK